jgi:hypothetical protein
MGLPDGYFPDEYFPEQWAVVEQYDNGNIYTPLDVPQVWIPGQTPERD